MGMSHAYGIFGTGVVGQTLGTKLVELGHRVMMGSREAGNPKALEWAAQCGPNASTGTFADAARFGQTLLNCTKGEASLEALRSVDRTALEGKVLIDTANALDFSEGTPPMLLIANTDSLGESIQREFPEARVVKAFNTCNTSVMTAPQRVPGDHDIFLCGNDPAAKQEVEEMLRSFGWKSVIDLGGIRAARATEALMPIWMILLGKFGSPVFNFHIVRGS
jgi:predicted dinucleotide-binding enzyme